MDDSESRRSGLKAERKVTPAFTLHAIGSFALTNATRTEEGSHLEIVTALLMCALTMEAVLNHAGVHVFSQRDGEPVLWDAIERLSPRKKLEVIIERCHHKVDFGGTPFQEFSPIFKFRDDLVHGKTSDLSAEDLPIEAIAMTMDVTDVPSLQAPWERLCNMETARRWREAVVAMADEICTAAGCTNPTTVGYPSSWSL